MNARAIRATSRYHMPSEPRPRTPLARVGANSQGASIVHTRGAGLLILHSLSFCLASFSQKGLPKCYAAA
jgi:hypothetical protein